MGSPDELLKGLEALSSHLKQIGRLPKPDETLCVDFNDAGEVQVRIIRKAQILDIDFDKEMFTPANTQGKLTVQKRRGMIFSAWQYVRQSLGYETVSESRQVAMVMEPVSGAVIERTSGTLAQLRMQWTTEEGVYVMVQTPDGMLHVAEHSLWTAV